MSVIESAGQEWLRGDSGFALLRFEQTRILVPRQDIRILELAIDMDRNDAPVGAVGWIAFGVQRCPVYCLSGDMSWLTEVPADRPICAVMAAEGHNFGLLCSEATLLHARDLAIHELPSAMAVAGLPFDQLAVHAGALACVSTAMRLLTDLQRATARGTAALRETCS
jgi:hypothetical protein